MLNSVAVVFAIAGVVALFLSIIGGGIRVKEVEIPHSPPKSRIIVGFVGVVFIGISLWLSLITSTASTPQPIDTVTPSITQISATSTSTIVVSTETSVPSPTQPESSPTENSDFYIEDFSNGSKYWELGAVDSDCKTATKSITDNVLRWQLSGKQSCTIAMGYPSLPVASDINLEATFNLVNASDDIEYGLTFRRSDDGAYRFYISPSGSFALFKYSGSANASTKIIGYTHPAIPIKLNEENTLKVLAIGNNIRIYINGNLVGDIRDETYKSGLVDVIANINEGEKLTLDIINFKLEILTP